MILHIPHSSKVIPENFRDQIVLSDDDLAAELLLMTDAFTDELFFLPETTIVRFPISRLLVDVERFMEDSEEPMSRVGMGMIYTRTAYGKRLRRALQPHEKRTLVTNYYESHHQTLLACVKRELEEYGKALIVDCHSFPSRPLPSDQDQSVPRPDFCIGADSFHTPSALIHLTVRSIEKMGYSVRINQPYAGAIVPMAYLKKDSQVASIMIEVKRTLYMDELTGMKVNRFNSIKEQIQRLLSLIQEFQKQAEAEAQGGRSSLS
jgi:N-formylglutamate amidohydrolase